MNIYQVTTKSNDLNPVLQNHEIVGETFESACKTAHENYRGYEIVSIVKIEEPNEG